MKKFGVITLIAFLISVVLVGCQMTEDNSVTSSPSKEYHDALKGQVSSDPAPVNYMDEIKSEIHDELFREASEETLDIIDRIFKHLKIDTISSSVDGNNASVLMNITTVNAGKAWVVGMERYAIACAENLFAESYDDDATLYSYYLDEFESCVRHADYITMPITVEMDYYNCRWEWDLDDDVVNAITGQLLAAIEGDLNSSNIVITVPEVEDEVPPVETDTEIVQPEQNNTSPIVIMGYDIATGYDDQKCLVVKYKWTNTTEQTVANWSEISIKAYQNGVQLDTNFAKYESKYEELDDNRDREIRPGVTLEMVRFFTLKDPNSYNNIEIEFSNYWENIIYAKGIAAF